MTKCIAEPLSRMQIAGMAKLIRKVSGEENTPFFDIVRFLDVVLPKIDPGFSFIVDEKSTLGECHGITYPDRNEIHIREDVYERACEGRGRDRLTLAHELFHLLQHTKENISYARIGENSDSPTYMDPEWQADAFGGELLIPSYLVKGMSADEIVEKCQVSRKAAYCQLRKM